MQVVRVLGPVLEVLHDELKNDKVGIAIEVDVKLQELLPQTPNERWTFVSKDNPWLQQMAQDLQLRPR